MSHNDPAPPVEIPIPPRYWWWRRIARCVAGVLVLLIGSYVFWWTEADRRMNRRIDEMRARGEPVWPDDFQPKPVRKGRNAAAYLRVICEDLLIGDSRVCDNWLIDVSLLADADAQGVVPLDALRQQRAAFRSAVGREYCDWGIRLRTPMMQTSYPDLAPQRTLCKAMNALARYEAQHGRVAESLGIATDLLRHAEFLAADPILVSALVGVAQERLTRDTIEQALPLVTAADCDAIADLRTILNLLNDETKARESMRQAFCGERAMPIDAVVANPEHLRRGVFGESLPGASFPILRPWRQSDVLRSFDHYDALFRAIDEEDTEAARAILPKSPRFTGIHAVVRLFSMIFLPSLERAAGLHIDRLAERRRLTAQIARRLFEIDHGRVPVTAAELVPDYLRAAYVDPYEVPSETEVAPSNQASP